MGFLDTLRNVLGGARPAPGSTSDDLAVAWGLTDDGADAGPTRPGDLLAGASAYDRANWLRKLKRILGGLPATQNEWAELMSEAGALKLDPDWVQRSQVEEFLLLVRRAVSDRNFTADEHRTLDLARDLIGIPEAEAEATLRVVVAEAEAFFNRPVQRP